MRITRYALPLVALPVLLLAACGLSNGGAGGPVSPRPASATIKSMPVTGEGPSTVTIDSTAVAGALYDATLALLSETTNQACPAIAGPRYELTFLTGNQIVLSATADQGGCGSVTLGANDIRAANEAFWQLLDKDIADATPAVRADTVTVVSLGIAGQPATSTQITSAAQAQAIYDAMRALPVAAPNQLCPTIAGPQYAMVFTAGDTQIRANTDQSGCGTVQFGQGSARQPDAAFWQLLAQQLAGATSQVAVPSQLDIKQVPTTNDPSGTASATTIQGQAIIGQLYTAIYALPSLPSDAKCPTIVGTQYGLTFLTAEGIELVAVIADASGCGTVTLIDGDVRRADQSFWTLLQKAQGR